MTTPLNAAQDFATKLTHLFSEGEENGLTDIFVRPDQPVRARLGPNNWVNVYELDPCDDFPHGQVTTHIGKVQLKHWSLSKTRFDNLMSSMFSEDTEGAKRNERWFDKVDEGNGCIYPMLNLMPDFGEGSGEDHLCRARITLQRQDMGKFGMMIRMLRPVPTSVESLGLPSTVLSMLEAGSGLILVSGPTGAGKSTTIAALLHQINQRFSANILLIEDPTEYIHKPVNSTFTYREVGPDVRTFVEGVEQGLRFVPDVFMIGEIRDANTMRAAMRAAESGHLVLASMHAATTFGSIQKCLGYLSSPGEQASFASSLVGVISQSLLPNKLGVGKVLLHEILDLMNSNLLSERISLLSSSQNDGKGLAPLEHVLMSTPESISIGSRPFKDSVMEAVRAGKVDPRLVVSLVDPESRKEMMLLDRAMAAQVAHAKAQETVRAPAPEAPPSADTGKNQTMLGRLMGGKK